MVKELKDNFLMSSQPVPENPHIYCYANSSDDDLTAVDNHIGNGELLDDTSVRQSVPMTDEAPSIEYDLEAELARALSDDRHVDAGAAVGEAPSMEFSGLIEQEFEKALSEQAQLIEETVEVDVSRDIPPIPINPPVATEIATENVSFEQSGYNTSAVSVPEAPVAEPVSTVPVDVPVFDGQQDAGVALDDEKNSAFAEQLARLLAEPDAVVSANAIPELNAETTAASVVAGSLVSDAPSAPVPDFEPEAVAVAVPEAAPKIHETEDPLANLNLSEDQDFSDPVAEFQPFFEQTDPAPPPAAVPEHFKPAFDNKPIETVLGATAALGAAAVGLDAVRPKPEEDATPFVLPPATTLPEFDEDFSGELDAAFREESYSEDELFIPPPESRGPRVEPPSGGRKVAFVILAIALLGGVGALASNYIGGSSGEAPIILANEGAVKVKPKEAGGQVVLNQDQTVYKTVNGVTPESVQATLENKTEKPLKVARVQPADTQSDQQKGGVTEAVANGTGPAKLNPRSVRTVVVRPDGTIVSSSRVSAVETQTTDGGTEKVLGEPAVKPDQANALKVAPSEPNKILTNEAVPVVNVKPAEIIEIRASEPNVVPTPAVIPVKPTKVAKVETKAPKPVAKRVAAKKPKLIKTAKPVAKKVATKPVSTKPSAGSSAYAVQVSSRKSPDAARTAWSKISKRFASVVGGRTPDIRRAKIKGKGTFYQVRLPAANRANAQALCTKLKSAGGSCFVSR